MPRRNTPLRAIRQKCLECSGGNKQEVLECVIGECPLFPYRLGVDPQAQALLSEGASESDDSCSEGGDSGRKPRAPKQKQHTLF